MVRDAATRPSEPALRTVHKSILLHVLHDLRDRGPYSQTSDDELLERFAAGQKEAAGELLSRYHGHAYCVAARILPNHADAQDAVQDGFVHALAALPDFRRDCAFKAWLLGIVRNDAMNLGRKRGRRRRLLRFEAHAVPHRPGEDPTLNHERTDRQRRAARTERKAMLRAAEQRTPLDEVIEREEDERAKELANTIRSVLVSNATPEMRRVLQLRLDGLTWEEIGVSLGCSEKTARNIRTRLGDRVLRELAARGHSVG